MIAVGTGLLMSEKPEPEMTARVLRHVRPLLVTGAVWELPAGAHVLGGGRLPEAEISVALMALVLSAVTLVLGRRLCLGRVVGVLGIGQVLLHEAFSPFSREAALWRFVFWIRPLMHDLQLVSILWSAPAHVGSGLHPMPSPWRNHRVHGIRGPPVHGVPLARPV